MRFGRKPILILGASGMLGRSWSTMLKQRGTEHVALGRPKIDLTNLATLDEALNGTYGYVINCAAWTDVDKAELAEEEATKVNGLAPAHLAERCKQRGVTLVHYSTDYVFSGGADQPYGPDEPRAPINAYGRSKAFGERAIEASGCHYLLIRASWSYAPWGKNMVRTIAGLAGERATLRFVNDQYGRPTSTEHLATATARLLDVNATGTYHVTDEGECTWFEFACQTVQLLGSQCRVDPCSTKEFSRPARRPRYSVLDLAKTEAVIGRMSPWQANLKSVVQRLEPQGEQP